MQAYIRRHTFAVALCSSALIACAGVAPALADPPDHIEVKGRVTSLSGTCPDREFRIGTQVVVTTSRTRFDDGFCSALTAGMRVEAEGMTREDGKLVAYEIDLR